MNLDQALPTFLAESRELLRDMEDALLRLEQQPDDDDAVNAVFRAAHTIKGSAGLFGLDSIVAFTHAAENALDHVREGTVPVTGELVALLLNCGDHIGHLLDYAGVEPIPDAALRQTGEELVGRLHVLSANNRSTAAGLPVEQDARVEASGGREVSTDNWHISLRFGRDVLRNGMDPMSFLRYLGTVGELVSVTTLIDALPDAGVMDPESCYIGLEIDLRSETDKKTLEDVFEFIREDSVVRILPPRCKIDEYVRLIRELPEEEHFLGEMLVASGALTQHELEEGLSIQKRAEPQSGRMLGEILVNEHVVEPEIVEAALDKQKQVRAAKGRESRSLRVHADKLDHLINLVGELVIAGANANLLAHRSGDGALQEATSAMTRLVEEIRDGALKLRMVEIGETFQRFQRVVRDVSRELGKEIELVISGADTELDKGVVEKLGDPLTHLVRNSIDHGIEPPEVRAANGKPAQGRVHLNAYHDSGSIVLEVADDGGGLKRDAILRRAQERGLIGSGQQLTDSEVYLLIFEPGFSTAAQVTNISGRGVGMDVVRRNIEALRGTVEIESREGNGTTVRIRLPLTLAIIDGFLVGVGASSYVIPLDMVLECVELSGAEQSLSYLNLRGEVLPLLHLRERFGLDAGAIRRSNVVVVQYGGQKAGLVVDELLGEFQTVIKPLGRIFANLKGVSGSTILGSGEVALILDVPALVHQSAQKEAHALREIQMAQPALLH